MSGRLRLLIGLFVVAVVYLAAVPIVGYVLNHNETRHNRTLIVRVASDESQTSKLTKQNATLVARLTADETTLKANTIATKKATCLAGNDYRMQDLALWHFIFATFPGPQPTASDLAHTAQFLAFLAVHDKQRNC